MKGSHFYTLILSSDVQDRRLAMPRKFIRTLGEKLSNVAMLKVPGSKEWAIELSNDKGRVWLQTGWHGFMDYYSIDAGHVLVFRYKGNSQFDVIIFSETACEIQYPYDDRVLESMPKGPVHITEATAFTSGNPFCTVTMRPSYVSNRFTLNLPAVLSKTYLKEHIREVTLQVSDGHTWQVNCSRKNNAITLCKGWKEFVLDNGLKVEDICIFELLDKKEGKMEVSIFKTKRNTNSAQPKSRTATPCFTVGKRKSSNVYPSRKFVDDRETNFIKQETCEEFGSIFRGVAQEGTFQFTSPNICEHNFSVPPGFTPIRPSSEDQQRTKNNGSPERPSRFHPRGFQSEDSLVAVSEALKVESHCMKREMRDRECSVLPLKRRDVLAPLPWKHGETSEGIIPAGAFTSKRPFCTVIMRPSYVNGCFIMSLPNRFAKKYLKTGTKIATLEVSDGRVWQVRCFGGVNFKIINGWKNFVIDNHLNEDDICIFELVDREHIRMKVTIFRVGQESKQRKCSPGSSKKPSCELGRFLGNMQKQDQYTERKRKYTDRGFGASVHDLKRQRGFISDTQADEFKQERCETIGKYTESTALEEKSFSLEQQTDKLSFARRSTPDQLIETRVIKTMASTSNNPFCMVTMRPAYLGSFLNFPSAFAENHLKDAFGGVILRVPTGETWQAQFSATEPRKLTKGWKAFVLDNHLKQGDICIFQLSNSNHIELIVTIIRAHKITA